MDVRPQLFLLPFAGGNCYSLTFLRPFLETDFELIPLELPGRGKRFREKLLRSKKEAINDYLEQITRLRNKSPYLLFGHSMGAALGFDIAAAMEATADPAEILIVSGNCGPREGHREKMRHNLEESLFIEELERLGGIPNEVIENKELFAFFNPIIRADFEVIETSYDDPVPQLYQTPIIAIMGDKEEFSDKITNWKNYTHASFSSHIFEGNHFFITNNPQELVTLIINTTKKTITL